MKTILEQFTAARLVSVPLLSIATPDQNALVGRLAAHSAAADGDKFPLLTHDTARGIMPLNKAAEQAMQKDGISPDETHGFVEAMIAVQRLPKGSVVFVFNAHRQLNSMDPASTATAVQAVSNLRDTFKLNWRMAVLLQPGGQTMPPEIKPDVIGLVEELPGPAVLEKVVKELYASARRNPAGKDLKDPSPAQMSSATDALSGLSEFGAETVTAMCMSTEGVDIPGLWGWKRSIINSTPGLTMSDAKETLDDVIGCSSVKTRLRQHKTAKKRIGVVLRIDEGSDAFAAVEGGDSNGVKTDQQRGLMTEMEEHGWRGVITMGVPGAGKSLIGRAFANELGVPGLDIDFGAMESKWQGESEQQLRHAISVIKAMGNGEVFVILTCNSLRGLRPQFMRRFKRGVFFFDLPTAEERAAVWAFYEKKFGLPKQERPEDAGWTPAEIKECCESAWDTGVTLLEAAKFIIPVSRSRAHEIEEMRKEANGRFLDAGRPGAYIYTPEVMAAPLRAIALPDGPVAVSKPGRRMN